MSTSAATQGADMTATGQPTDWTVRTISVDELRPGDLVIREGRGSDGPLCRRVVRVEPWDYMPHRRKVHYVGMPEPALHMGVVRVIVTPSPALAEASQ